METPCYNCEKRTLGCHSYCKEYKSYQEEKDGLKQEARAKKVAENYIVDRQVGFNDRKAKREQLNRRYKLK